MEDPSADSELDETLEETFPASDAPANTVVTGTHLAVEPLPAESATTARRVRSGPPLMRRPL